MPMNYAAIIKKMVTTQQVFEFYGYKPNQSGFVHCPFHSEKTASLKVYKGDGGWNCFGCGENGDVIDFVKKLFGLGFYDAIEKINLDFSLGLAPGNPRGHRLSAKIAAENFRLKKEREQKQREWEAVKKEYYTALDRWIELDRQARKYKPQNDTDELHPLFVEAVQGLPFAEYQVDAARGRMYEYEQSRNNRDS